jgi:hypothetical protein
MSISGRWAIAAFLTSGVASASVDVSEGRAAAQVTAVIGAESVDSRADAPATDRLEGNRRARISRPLDSRRSHSKKAAWMTRADENTPGCEVLTEPILLRSTATHGLDRVQGTASVTLRCAAGTAYAITVGRGAHYERGRRMLDAETGGHIAYELFLDPDHLVRWDEDHPLRGVSDGRDAHVTVFARASAELSTTEGSYADDIDVIIEY